MLPACCHHRPLLPTLQNGVLGHGHEKDQTPKWPTRIPCLEAKQVAAGWKHSTAVTTGGRLCTWGWGGSQGGRGFAGRGIGWEAAAQGLDGGRGMAHPCAACPRLERC